MAEQGIGARLLRKEDDRLMRGLGEFVADMLVDGLVLVENKAVHGLLPVHEAQLINYLTATGVEVGLLFNFGAERLEFKRKTRTYKPQSDM